MAKRLSKTLWYGTGLDTYGKPLLPPVATNESDLNGLHRGELFMHLDKDNVTLWALSSNNEVVQIAGKQGEIDIDLSDYLLKSTWDKVWELRKDNNGVEYIYSKLPVVTRYGITMYANNGEVEVEPIYAGLPIDRQTLIWKDGVLMVNPELDLGGGGGIDENELRDYLTRNDYAKKSDITTALSGYATTSSLNAVSTKLNDFLEGSDTDTVINKWKEVETFLSGLTESDNLATILTGKADKSYVDTNFVTIAGTEDVTGLHNFVNGLKVGGIELIQKNGNAFLKGNLVVEGGITMYGDGEGGSSAPLYSTLGLLKNVDESNDAVASVDRVLFQSAGSNVWSWKALSEIGGGGGSVSGDYLPLSGGTLTGTLNTQFIRPSVNAAYQCGTSSLRWDNIYSVYGNFSNSITINGNTVVHAGNYSSYALPLSGGTLTNSTAPQLTIKNNSGTDAYLYFSNADDKSIHVGLIKFADYGVSATFGFNHRIIIPESGGIFYRTAYSGTTHSIWHSGNDGSGSGLDADLLDGLEGSKFYREQGRFWSSYATSVLENGSFYAQGYSPVSGAYSYGSILNFKVEDKVTQFYITDGAQAKGTGGRIFFRDSWNAQESISTRWLEIITSENIENQTVSKANQLTTARTIWGQSFDGTGNVDGDLIFLNDNYKIGWRSNNAFNYTNWYGHYFITRGADRMCITDQGNVGIGTTNPQNKLDVNGYVEANSFILDGYGAQTFTIGVVGVGAGGLYLEGPWYDNTATQKLPIIISWRGGFNNQGGIKLDASANMLVTGGITMYSDQRKKTILNHVELSLKDIANAPLIEHYYNSDQNKTTHVGSIAQYWADLNDWFCKLDNEGFYTMEIQNCALASAISIARHLEKYESKTDKTIRKMKKRIQELEDEVERLKKGE